MQVAQCVAAGWAMSARNQTLSPNGLRDLWSSQGTRHSGTAEASHIEHLDC